MDARINEHTARLVDEESDAERHLTEDDQVSRVSVTFEPQLVSIFEDNDREKPNELAS